MIDDLTRFAADRDFPLPETKRGSFRVAQRRVSLNAVGRLWKSATQRTSPSRFGGPRKRLNVVAKRVLDYLTAASSGDCATK